MTDGFYLAFEDKHRGSRSLIASRLRFYLPFVEPLKLIYENCLAIDLGCGRGEWLELMGEVGIDARGVDIDDAMLAACREHGLAAELGDAIDYLRGLPDNSAALISSFHVVEHIHFADLQTLVQEALRVLVPAGLLILETPNPENLSVGACTFYIDPTHQRPIPPQLLLFLPEYYGFARSKVVRLQQAVGLQEAVTPTLNDVLTGASPDYAVVAQKGSDDAESMARFDGAFSGEYGIDASQLAMRYDNAMNGMLREILRRIDRSAEMEARAVEAEQRLVVSKAELLQAQSDISQSADELARLQAFNAAQKDELDQTKVQLSQVHAELAVGAAEVDRLLAHLTSKEGELSQAQDKLAAVYTSTSWRLTGPLRATVKAIRALSKFPRRLITSLKIWLRPLIVRAGTFLETQPITKKMLLSLLRPFPWLLNRLAQAARPLEVNQADLVETSSRGPEDLVASARRVYKDLLDARAVAQSKNDRKL